MGILSKWFGKNREKGGLPEPCRVIGNYSVKMVDITAVVLIKGDSVSIRVKGLEHLNVCLASFLTKGVSYAQEKYNEYQANKDTDAIVEEPKAEKPRRETARPTQRDIDEMRAWAKAQQAKRESK